MEIFAEIPAGSIVKLGVGIPTSSPSGQPSPSDVVSNIQRNLAANPVPVPIAVWEPMGLKCYTPSPSSSADAKVCYVGNGLMSEYFARGSTCGLEGHGMLVVGYDDGVQPTALVSTAPSCSPSAPPDWTPDAASSGAFLVQNSWGSAWGIPYPGPIPSGSQKPVTSGFVWISYDTFRHILQVATGYQPPPSDSDGSSMEVRLEKGKKEAGPISARLVAPYQYVRAAQSPPRVYLVFPYTISRTVRLERFVVVPPSGPTLTDVYGPHIRAGYLHLSRQDGHQWPAGEYELRLHFMDAAGARYVATARAAVAALHGPPAADAEPAAVLGTNGKPLP